jgi:hypothetical protein
LEVSSEPEALVARRLTIMTIHMKDLGLIAIYSVYGHASDGEGESNKWLIDFTSGESLWVLTGEVRCEPVA